MPWFWQCHVDLSSPDAAMWDYLRGFVEQYDSAVFSLPEYAQDLEDFMSGFGFETERWDLPERADEIDWTNLISGDTAIDFGQRVALGVISGFTIVTNGMSVSSLMSQDASARRTPATNRRTPSCTCGAARPIPAYSIMVSNMSSISR